MIKGKNEERLEIWRVRWRLATGKYPRTDLHLVHPCQICGVPVWRPEAMRIPPEAYTCNKIECKEKVVENVVKLMRGKK